MPFDYYVAWWNLENLFDVEDSPRRPDKVSRAIGKSIEGWSQALLDRKIDRLASVVAQMNDGRGPDLLGVCEVENEFVMQRLRDAIVARLPNRVYEVTHADTVDRRGIDVAFIFDSTLFAVPPDQTFQHVVMRRTATRELFQANFQTHRGRTWAVFGNHWPSRSGGEYESRGYRAIAGETLSYFHERVIEVHGRETPVMVMGDFNDEPFDDSLVRHALSTRQPAAVLNGTSPRLLNLMWGPAGAVQGTYYYSNQPNLLDQFLVNKNMIEESSPVHVVPGSVEVIVFEGMAKTGDYPVPIAFGGMGKTVDQDGFSDHFPIGLRVRELD